MNINVEFSVRKVCAANWRLFVLAAVVALVGSCIVSASIPSSYASRARISIDTNDKNPLEKGNNLLSNLKSLLDPSESNVLSEPRVYVKILQSDSFVSSLATASVVTERGQCMTFAHYIENFEKLPWWNVGEHVLQDMIKDRVRYEMNTRNYTITIQVDLQDPVVACAMVDTVINRLHGYMTTYMQRKAEVEYRNRMSEFSKTETDYHESMQRKAQFADSNFDVEQPDVAIKFNALQEEADRLMSIRNEAGIKAALAKMEVERTRPTFIKLVSNYVPLSPLHPHWVANFFIWLFYSQLAIFLFVLYRTKYRMRYYKTL